MRPLAYALAALALAVLVCLPTRPPEIVDGPATDPVVWVTVTPTTTVTVTPTVWVTR